MSNEKFTEKMGDAMLDPRHNRIWKGVLWLLGLLLLVDVLLSWYWSCVNCPAVTMRLPVKPLPGS